MPNIQRPSRGCRTVRTYRSCWSVPFSLCHARWLRLPRSRHRAPQEPGQCAAEDPGRFRHLDGRYLLHWLCHRLRRCVLRQRRAADGAGKGLRFPGPEPRRVLFLATFVVACRPSSRRHRRTRQVRRAVHRHGAHRGSLLSAARGRRPEQELRPAGAFLQRHVGPGVPRLRRLHRGACGGRLDWLLGRAPTRAASRALRRAAPSAFRPRRSRGSPWVVAVVHRLVRLQRDECPVAERRHGVDRAQLADGHVRRHHRRD